MIKSCRILKRFTNNFLKLDENFAILLKVKNNHIIQEKNNKI